MSTRNANKLFLLFLGLTLLLGACAGASPTRGAPAPSAPQEAPAPEAEMMDAGYGAGYRTSDTQQAGERLVIKNADLSIVVPEPAESMQRISALAEEMGGFVVSARLNQDQVDGVEVPRAFVTIRVPAERLDEALERIEAESDRLPLNRNISSQDVTAEYTDLQSRLRNLEAAEEQLRELMASATRTEDVLSIFQQLTETRSQIEVIKGQIQYYETSARLSSISVDLTATAAVRPLTIGNWQPVGVAREALQALISAVRFLVDAGIWIIVFFLPVGLLVFLPLYLLFRLVRRLRARRKQPSAPPAPPAAAS